MLYVTSAGNNISIIPWCHGLLLEEREYLNKTTWPAEVTYNIYHIQLYRVHLAIHYEVGLLKQNLYNIIW
jgi:hypothetical protein